MLAYYVWIKGLHLGCALLSLPLFLLRWWWCERGHALCRSVWARRVPHYIDTLFVITAVLLALSLRQTPFINAPWLSAKVSALVLYIGLGFAALRLTHPLARRLAVGVAIGCYAYIVGVAISKTPLSWWALL